MSISFDTAFLFESNIGPDGLPESVLETDVAQKAYEQIQEEKQKGVLGFTKLVRQDLSEVKALAEEVRNQCQAFVVIGIGGSDLGSRAVHRALNHQFYNLLDDDSRGGPRLFFLGDTTDPVAIQEVLDVLDLEQTIFTVISKSGNTIEQMSTFVLVRNLLLEELGEEKTRERIIIVTDAEKGTLRDIVQTDGYRSLPVPADVGGRFSVLATVGLFPLAVAGIDIELLLDGAREMDERDSQGSRGNVALQFAVTQHELYKRGKHISVFMPYVYGLREVGFWYRQLWAESLGKALDLDGNTVETGPTPIASVGPTDQHSQSQLYTEGPRDKVLTFVKVKQHELNITLDEAYPQFEGVSYLKGHDFAEIIEAEQKSTAYALAKAGRPSGTFELDALNEQTLGAFLYMMELAVSYAGVLFKVNTFDQPGVELSKQYMYGMLGRPGFEEFEVK